MSAAEGNRSFVSWRDPGAPGVRSPAPSSPLHAEPTPFPPLEILEEAGSH